MDEMEKEVLAQEYEELSKGFLEAAKICIRNSVHLHADYFAVERMVQEAIADANGDSVYCDIHK